MAMRRGATTAMGVPKPAIPWRNEAKTHPKLSTRKSSLLLNRWIPTLSASKAPARSVIR